ncbi:MAG: peptidase T [Deltaproteobacteria bacterium]|nr:MAG: peptidase T [Deltaproteobacteria bacterium]
MARSPVVVVHGGAASTQVVGNEWREMMACMRESCEAAAALLKAGQSAVEAAVAAVLCMEEHPLLDAGYGSHLDQRGRVTLDASIFRGEDLAFAGVVGLEHYRNPILVVQHLLDDPNLVLLHGEGAEAYAASCGLPKVANETLIVEREQARFDKLKREGFSGTMTDFLEKRPFSDTVGVIVQDAQGRLVAANSTGGTPYKRLGRIGDTPLPGCGAMADDAVGAVCCTGWGEAITRVTLASRVFHHMEQGLSAEQAVRQGVRLLWEKTQSECGVLSVSHSGELGVAFNTPCMPWAALTLDGEWRDADTHNAQMSFP